MMKGLLKSKYYPDPKIVLFLWIWGSLMPGVTLGQGEALYASTRNAGGVYQQEEKMTPLLEILKDFEKRYHVKFAINNKIVANKFVDKSKIQFKEFEISLNALLNSLDLKYEKVDNYYIIKQNTQKSNNIQRLDKKNDHDQRKTDLDLNKGLLLEKLQALQTWEITKDIRLNGKVTSQEDGQPLPGVNVVVKGTTVGTTTGLDGKYSLAVADGDVTLVYSYIGYVSEEVLVNNRTNIDVVLKPDIQSLQEVIVVGYGVQRKSDLTGSVIAISEKDFNQGQMTTPEQLIMGKVPGVQITSNGGAPGSGSRIRIRGGSSLNASNDPLIVIDGVPLDNDQISGAPNPLTLINPNDIESFNVLKDASATAIYGSRASNGVIIITTKKGKAGDKLNIDFSSVASVSEITETVDVLDGDEYRAVVNQYATEANKALLGNANTDWQDLIYRNAFSHDNNLSVSGAYKTIPFRASVGYLGQEGVLLTSKLKRTSASLNLNPSLLDDHLKISVNVKGVITNSVFADEGVVGVAASFDPTQPVYADNQYGGYFEWLKADTINDEIVITPNDLAPKNPLGTLKQRDATSTVKRSIGNIQLDYRLHFLPELKANLNLGYDVSETEGSTILPPTMADVYVEGGSRQNYSQSKTNNLLDFYLNYVKDFEMLQSRLDVTGGYSYQSFITDNPAYPTLNFEGDTIVNQIPARLQNVLISFFGRINYSLKDRYLLTATIRRDGSSRFSPDNRWGTFPSLAFAWKINEESFLKNSSLISELKLRLGYGVTGQQDLGASSQGYYPYLARYVRSNKEASYLFGNEFYQTLRAQGYDINIKWEETQTYNVGLDYGLFDGRLSGSLEYYEKYTKDLLAEIPVPAGSNLTNRLFTNVGKIRNSGVEASININAIRKDRFSWDLGINGTYNQSEVTKLSKTQDDNSTGIPVGGIGGGVGNTIQIHTVGYPAYSFYVYKQVYDNTGMPVEGLYVDMNKDGVITADDMYRYKNPEPKMFLGFNTQLNYDRFSLGFTLRGSVGNYMYNNRNASAYYWNVSQNGWLITIPRSVTETNFVGADDPNRFSDHFIENASFLRMDNVNLGYNFGEIINKVNLNLTASCQNVFVISKYSGLDPEISSGIDNSFYPRPRIYSLGLNINFSN